MPLLPREHTETLADHLELEPTVSDGHTTGWVLMLTFTPSRADPNPKRKSGASFSTPSWPMLTTKGEPLLT
jgi:hypothetical protein